MCLALLRQQVGGLQNILLSCRTRLDDVCLIVYQNVSISKGSSEIAILVENVAGQPVSLNLGQPQRASTPPCWVNLHFSPVNIKLMVRH